MTTRWSGSNEFIRMTGGEKVVNTRRLLWLAVVYSGNLKLKDDHNPKSSGRDDHAQPHTVVMTPQQFVGVAKVNYYLTELNAGESIKPARVVEVGDGDGWWHLDGLHRLLAARIVGQPLEAKSGAERARADVDPSPSASATP